MTWLTFLKVLLAAVNTVAGIVREKQLMDAGEARATARSLAVLASRLGIGEQVIRDVEAMTDDELNAELRGET